MFLKSCVTEEVNCGNISWNKQVWRWKLTWINEILSKKDGWQTLRLIWKDICGRKYRKKVTVIDFLTFEQTKSHMYETRIFFSKIRNVRSIQKDVWKILFKVRDSDLEAPMTHFFCHRFYLKSTFPNLDRVEPINDAYFLPQILAEWISKMRRREPMTHFSATQILREINFGNFRTL